MAPNEEQKLEWAEFHAQRMNLHFEKWQKSLGISGDDYCRCLVQELLEACDDPLKKSLIESISQ